VIQEKSSPGAGESFRFNFFAFVNPTLSSRDNPF